MVWEPSEGAIVDGRYRLERKVGAGGAGSVWAATTTAGDARCVALKFLHAFAHSAKLVARFENESTTLARLESDHIVRIERFGEHEETPFMVLELLEGEDLGARLAREKRLGVDVLLPIARQIADGLSAAHEAGVVHRDLKPQNVFLCSGGSGSDRVKLLDFGIASDEEAEHRGLTTVGRSLGSPHYMSPEQAQGRDVDARSDLWSFGVIVYRALTGRRPFEGDIADVMVAIAKRSPPEASSLEKTLPKTLDAFLTRALKKDRVDRFQTAEELIRALEAACRRAPETAAAPQTSASPTEAAPEPAPAPPTPAGQEVDGPRSARSGGAPAFHPALLYRSVIAAVILACSGGLAWANRAAFIEIFSEPPSATRDVAAGPPPSVLSNRIPPCTLDGPGGSVTLPLDRKVVMNVWLQDCPDCMPSFDAWAALRKGGELPDARIVNVAYGRADVGWAERHGVDTDLVFDDGAKVVQPLGISSFTTFVVGPKGEILFRGNPREPDFAARLRRAAE